MISLLNHFRNITFASDNRRQVRLMVKLASSCIVHTFNILTALCIHCILDTLRYVKHFAVVVIVTRPLLRDGAWR